MTQANQVAYRGVRATAADDDLTQGQKAVISSVESQVNSLLGSQLDGEFQMVNYPSGFNYGINYGGAGYYNPTTLATIDGLVGPTSNGMLSLNGNALHTTYSQILQAASYQYSKADEAVINSPDVASQAQAILAAAKSDSYPVTKTYQAVILDVVAKNVGEDATVDPSTLSQAAKKITPLYPSLGAALSNYAQQLSPQLAIMNRQQQANLELTAAQNNSQKPTADNGGLETAADQYSVAYTPLPTSNQLLGGLNSESTISIKIDAANFSSKTTKLHVDGSASLSIPILDFLSIGIGGGVSYDMSRYTSKSSSLSMSMEYKGVTLFSAKPTPLSADYKTGWYDNDLLSSIVAGSGDDSVSGFKIPPSSQYNVDKTFGEGKTFGRLKTFVISQQPTITLVFSAAEASQLLTDFKQNASASVKLFGLFKIGEVNESYEVQTVDQNSAAGTVTIVLAPPKPTGTVPLDAQVAYVVGGVASYPPNDI